MKTFFKFLFASGTLVVAGIGLIIYFLFTDTFVEQVITSPDGNFTIHHKAEFLLVAFPGQGCDGQGHVKVTNREGKVLYDSGLQPHGMKCLPPYAFLPNRLLLQTANLHSEAFVPLFINSDGTPITRFSAADFDQILEHPSERDRKSLAWTIAFGKFGLSDDDLIASIRKLIQKNQIELASSLTSAVDLNDNREKLADVFEKFLTGNEVHVIQANLERLYQERPEKEYLSLINKYLLHSEIFWKRTAGIQALAEAKNVSNETKRKILRQYFDTNPELATEAMRELVKLGYGKEILSTIVKRYYESAENAAAYLYSMSVVSGRSDTVKAAVVHGLKHAEEGYWRNSFYFVRDDDELNSPDFIEPLLTLKKRFPDDYHIPGQVDKTVKRIRTAHPANHY